MKRYRIIQLFINCLFTIFAIVLAFASVFQYFGESWFQIRRHPLPFIIAPIATFVLSYIFIRSLTLNFHILKQNNFFSYHSLAVPKGYRVSLLLIIVSFLLILIVIYLPDFKVGDLHLSEGVIARVPKSFFILDNTDDYEHYQPVHVSEDRIFFFLGIISIFGVFYCSGLLNFEITKLPENLSANSIYPHIVGGLFFVGFGVLILFGTGMLILNVIELRSIDPNIWITNLLFSAFNLILISLPFLLYGQWIVRDGIRMLREKTSSHTTEAIHSTRLSNNGNQKLHTLQ